MQHAMMGAAETVGLEQPVGVADEIAIGEEQQFDQVEQRRLLAAPRPMALRPGRQCALGSAI